MTDQKKNEMRHKRLQSFPGEPSCELTAKEENLQKLQCYRFRDTEKGATRNSSWLKLISATCGGACLPSQHSGG
jgi:hypothetical protein